MPLHFGAPIWLLGLLAVPLVVLVGRRGTPIVRAGQHRAATAVRAVAVALLTLALAAPTWDSAGRAVDVAFLVDASDSAILGQADALAWIDAALDQRDGEERAALARFGREPRLEYSLRSDPTRDAPATVVDGTASDLARALRLGQGVLGSRNRRRVVLFTDGRENLGDVVTAAAELREAGVHVDVVPVGGGEVADVLVEEVIAPGRVREGQAFDVVAVLRNTGQQTADVIVVTSADGVEVDRQTVAVPAGRLELRVPQVAEADGSVRYEVRLLTSTAVADNDVGRAAVRVAGPPRVLALTSEDGAADHLADALEARSITTDVQTGALPALDRLLDYDTVVLVDVPATQLGEQGMVALDAFVREAGHGLVVVGGDDAYGLGRYDGTVLEDLLPVFARVRDTQRRPSVAEALVVDVSGSMAACHCRPDGFAGGGFDDGGSTGVNKTDITKEAVARAVRALQQQDLVGVLAYNAQAEWVIPLQSLPSDAVVDDALARLHPDGPTNTVDAVRDAIDGLRDANARLRHIVLFTDGFSDDPSMVAVAEEAAAAGITLSVVGTGEGAGEVLQDMAEAGGGRYYPGRDLLSIPDIIVNELQQVARPIITEGSFLPLITGSSAAVDGLTETPPLLGYLATTAKPQASQLLQIGEERDPLLASWQAGLGKAVAWTSDASSRWSQAWVSWDGYADFWAALVTDTFPAEEDPGFAVEATATAEGVRVEVGSTTPFPADVPAVAVVTTAEGERIEVPLERTGLGSFDGVVPATGEGVHAVRVVVGDPDDPLYVGLATAIRSYPAEYAATASSPDVLERIAAAGGGRLDPAPESVWDSAGLEPGRASLDLWGLLATLALVGLVADVGLRRLRLEPGDLRSMWRRGPATPEAGAMSEELQGLTAARDRARQRLTGTTGPPEAEPPVADRPAPTAPEPPSTPAAPTKPAPVPRPAEPAGDRDPADPAPTDGLSGLLEARRRARGERPD